MKKRNLFLLLVLFVNFPIYAGQSKSNKVRKKRRIAVVQEKIDPFKTVTSGRKGKLDRDLLKAAFYHQTGDWIIFRLANGESFEDVYNDSCGKIQRLISAGADPRASDQLIGATALHWLARSGCEDCVLFLANKKADVNAKTKNGNTPLCWVAEIDYFPMIRLLIELGASFDGPEKNDGCVGCGPPSPLSPENYSLLDASRFLAWLQMS